jgi:hypothetical protein
VNGPRVSLRKLGPEEAAAETEADALLTVFQQEHDGVKILRPHWADEPWRAEVREGMVPGENCATSGFLVADWPSELLTKLEKLFAGSDPEDDSG